MKIHNFSYLLSFCVAICSIVNVYGQKVFIDENLQYWFNATSEAHINHSIYFDEDSAHLHLEISFNKGFIFDDYHYMYELHESYHTLDIDESDTLKIEDHIIAIKADKINVYIGVPLEDNIDLAVFRMTNKKSGIDYVYDIPFIKDYNFSTDGLLLYEEDGKMPYLSNFINVKDPFQIKSISSYDDPIFVYYYSYYFDEAVPPMIIDNKPSAKQLVIDSVFTVQLSDTLSFSREGLYFFQKDSSSANGISIRVQDPYYPLVKTFDKVVEPLIYISTRTETDGIRNAANPKKAFEDYWLKLNKIPAVASLSVKKYYERVEMANYLFTNFEEGWKSDMGIIFIVFGPPNDVYKSEEIVDWVYNRDLNFPTVRFSFYKVKNVFTDQHYTLLRKKDYDKTWFKAVELWREGKK